MYIDKVSLVKAIDEDSYLNFIPSIKYLKENSIEFSKSVTFFVGENGSGKSTLIEALAVASGFNPEGGTKNYRFSTQDSHSELWQKIRIAKRDFPKFGYFLRAESFYNTATYHDTLEGNYYPPLHSQSHGESFMSVVDGFVGDSLYIFDEPEAALSPMRLMSLLIKINELIKLNCQFIIATHSPILMAFPDSQIMYLTENGIKDIPFCQTEHYIVTRQFLNNPNKMFDELFNGNK